MSETTSTDLAADNTRELPEPADQPREGVDSSLPPKFRHKRGLPEPAAEEVSGPDVGALAAGPSGSVPAPLAGSPPQPSRGAQKHARDLPCTADPGASCDEPAARTGAACSRPQPRGAAYEEEEEEAAYEEEEEEEEDDEEGLGVLRRGHKTTRLSVSKIQGRAEPRKPRIGPQYQAIVPPWLG